MTHTKSTVALVGVCGGAGATRLTAEIGATLARAGRDVGIIDLAIATQGFSDYVPGEINPDVTAVLADGEPFEAAMVELPWETEGKIAVCPARAPFERLARAGTAGAARTLEDVLTQASESFDVVLLDTPPVTTNAAVAGVTQADRIGLVVPPSERGVNALQRVRGRLTDVGATADTVVLANRADAEHPVGSADATIPESNQTTIEGKPAVLDPDTAFAPAIAEAASSLLDEPLELSFPETGLLNRLP